MPTSAQPCNSCVFSWPIKDLKMVQCRVAVQRASLRFKKLADNLCTPNKISSKIADNAKFEYGWFQSVVIKKRSEVFLTYDPRKERLDIFRGKYVRSEFDSFWHICKAALSNVDFRLTSWPFVTTCRRS